RPGCRAQAHVPAGQDLVALLERQGRHRGDARQRGPHAVPRVAAREPSRGAVDRLEQRAAVPHPRLAVPGRALPSRHPARGARRQNTGHVTLIRGDYGHLLADDASARGFRAHALGGRRMTLVTLHHSLYYAPRAAWRGIVDRTYRHLLARPRGDGPGAAIHA